MREHYLSDDQVDSLALEWLGYITPNRCTLWPMNWLLAATTDNWVNHRSLEDIERPVDADAVWSEDFEDASSTEEGTGFSSCAIQSKGKALQ